MENDFDALLEAKQENVRNWVQTQSLEIPPSTNSRSNVDSSIASQLEMTESNVFSDKTGNESKEGTNRGGTDWSSTGSFDFGESKESSDYGDPVVPASNSFSSSSFLSVNDNLTGESLTAGSTSARGHPSLDSINRLLRDLGYSPLNPEESIGKKMLLILKDIQQKRQTMKGLMDDREGWRRREDELKSRIRSLEVTLEETEKNQSALYQSTFKETEGAKKDIKALHDTKKRLEMENAKLKKEFSNMKRKYSDKSKSLDVLKQQIRESENERDKLKDKMRSRSEDVRTLEKGKEDACRNSKSLENSIRVKDNELCKLRLQYDNAVSEHRSLLERHSQLENALRNQEKENLNLKKTLQSTTESFEVRKAILDAENETKRLKEELGIERSRRNSAEQRIEKLGCDLKAAQQCKKQNDQLLKDKDAEIFSLEMEVKKLRLVDKLSSSSSDTSKKVEKSQKLKKQAEMSETDNRKLRSSYDELSQKYKILQKENLQLESKLHEAEHKIQKSSSEIAKLNDDLSEKRFSLKSVLTKFSSLYMDRGLRDTMSKLAEAEKKSASQESQLVVQSENVKTQEIQTSMIEKSASSLITTNNLLDRKLAQMELICERLKDKLREKIAKEENRVAQQKQSYTRLKQMATSEVDEALKEELSRADVFCYCQREIENLRAEISSLQQERRLCHVQIKQLENELAGYKRADGSANLPTDKMKSRLRLAERSITDLTAKLLLAKDARSEETEKLKSEKENLEMRIVEQKEMIQQLQKNPLSDELDEAKKQIKALKHKIKSRAHDDDHRPVDSVAVLKSSAPIDRIPRPQIVKILKNLCMMLEVSDPSMLLDRTTKLLRVVSTLPKVQSFVSEICEIILCKGEPYIPTHFRSDQETDISVLVPKVLHYWLDSFV